LNVSGSISADSSNLSEKIMTFAKYRGEPAQFVHCM